MDTTRLLMFSLSSWRGMRMRWCLAATLLLLKQASAGSGLFNQLGQGVREYCQWEIFNATCEQDEVILMRSSRYGRMRLGKCLITEVYIGCSDDVLPQLDARCSGRRHCDFALPDPSLHKQQSCPRDMTAYLEASYTCEKVAFHNTSAVCQPPLHNADLEVVDHTASPVPVGSTAGLISSEVAHRYGFGSRACPWTISAAPGQAVRLYLLDFSFGNRYKTAAEDDALVSLEFCQVYAIVREKGSLKASTICAAATRESVAYTSDTNHIEVEIFSHKEGNEPVEFALRYEAAGCPDIEPPVDGQVSRDHSRATITCNHTSQTWHLVCKDTRWIGEFKDCHKGAASSELHNDEPTFPSYGLVVAVLIGVVIGIICGFTMLGTVLWCKRRNKKAGRGDQVPAQGPGTVRGGQALSSHDQCRIHQHQHPLKGEYGYSHVWQVQSPPAQLTAPGAPYTMRPPATVQPSPDSAYHSYQGQANSLDSTVRYHHKRDHVYECPKFDSLSEQGTLLRSPYYREFGARGSGAGVGDRAAAGGVRHSLPDCVEVLAEAAEEAEEGRRRLHTHRPLGYMPIPDSSPVMASSKPEKAENQYT